VPDQSACAATAARTPVSRSVRSVVDGGLWRVSVVVFMTVSVRARTHYV